jgi:hypothetical protein
VWSITPILTHFRVIEGHIVHFGGFRKIRIVLDPNKLARSALRRSKEENFLYRMNTFAFELKIEQDDFLSYNFQNVP